MSRNPVLKKERNNKIKEAYQKYADEVVLAPGGKKVNKYRHEAILVLVGRKFYLEPGTIQNILQMKDEPDNQLELFNDKKPQ